MLEKRIPKDIIEIVKKYSRRLEKKERLPIDQVIVFGSQVSGKTHQWSDIDICVISPKFKEPLKALKFLLQKRNREEVILGLEPLGFTREDFIEGGSFIQRIKETGVVVK